MLCDEHMPPGAGNPFGDYSPSLVSLTVGAVMAMTGLDKTVGGVSSAMHWALAGLGSKAFMEGGVPQCAAETMKHMGLSAVGGLLTRVIQ